MADPDYFTLAEFRLLPGMDDDALYTDARVEAAAAYVAAVIEREVGTSFIPRSVIETHDGGDGSRYGIPVRKGWVRSVTSVTEDGNVIAPVPIDKDQAGVITKFLISGWPTPWAAGYQNIVITYEAGYSDEPPADIKEAALFATRHRLLTTNSNAGQTARRTRLTTEAGTFDLALPGRDAPFGLPEVDSVIIGWRDRIDAMGFA